MTLQTQGATVTTEQIYLDQYDEGRYQRPSVTADIALFTIKDGALCILLVQRGNHPYQGHWALPGGFIDVEADEDLQETAYRELAEETGLGLDEARGWYLEQLYTYSAKGRDPRTRVISTAYFALAPNLGDPAAGSDAAAARWWTVEDLEHLNLAFDHATIVQDALERVRAKLEYTNLAANLITAPFTLTELRRVYEAVWGTELVRSNFSRKVTAAEGFLVEADDISQPGQAGGKPARLYNAGDTTSLYPPFLRPANND